MAAPEPRIGQSQIGDLATICKIGPELLKGISAKLNAQPALIDRKLIDEMIVKDVGEDSGVKLSRFLFGIATALRQSPPTFDQIIGMLTDTAAKAVADDASLASWPLCIDPVTSLLNSKVIRIASKAIDISYDFERIFISGRFLTTLRPVFDEERSEIAGATVVQTFRLEYFDSNSEQASMSFAMDYADIESLRRACDLALKKGTKLAHESRTAWGKPTIMIGEKD